MCGFVGIALTASGAAPTEARLAAMCDTIVHRGPDDRGILTRAPFGVGFQRLSIIDLAGGHQPIFNETGDVAVVCNGELYGFRELREDLIALGHRFRTGSDVEVLVHLYEEYGERLVDRLVGMFAFAVFDWRDARRPKLLLGRDRLGIKPLYWSCDDEGLRFASEAKAILADGGPRRLRTTALLDYLVLGYVTGEEGAWEGIRRLPPGHLLSWSPGESPRLRRYWNLPLDGPRAAADDDEILEWVDRAVGDRMIADVPLGAFLSGGVDSTAVVTSMSSVSTEPVVACSVGFAEKRFDELDTARETAARLGLVHHTAVLDPDPTLATTVLPWHFDEPLADPSTVPTWLVSKMAREHVTVALSGDGGDETFAGYRRHLFDVAEHRARALIGGPGCRLAGWIGSWYPKLDRAPRFLRAKSVLQNLGADPARAYFDSLCQLSRAHAVELLAPELAAGLSAHDPFDAFGELYHAPRGSEPLYRAQYADFHGFLPDRILTKTDRASMGNSLEVRVPMLDHRLVERFAHLPTTEKVRDGRGKHALRRALRSRVPSSVLDGTKRGFDTPLREWIRGPLARTVANALETLPADWFRPDRLRAALAEHQSGARDHSNLLWSLLVLEHWRRRHGVTGLAG
ncbi:MAG: asparagine synthase (glutamine-hydrolyzing) [Planctomycetes bacterium]|nr:asparagine synthase (glutamine-hydrolyzing) [Planctomycetota bacterium]MCB9904132.1 asparagine synthase (glutamine-hydrolyzing) [Planctomycetota bacterium]